MNLRRYFDKLFKKKEVVKIFFGNFYLKIFLLSI